jgi:hypothetical protein
MFAVLLATLAACTAGGDSAADSAAPETPTITFLSPADGDTVTAGDVPFSVIVEHFALVDLAKDNEGEPEGYIGVSVDGTEVLQTSETTFDLALGTEGAVTVEAELFFSDGDGLDEAFGETISASISLTVAAL